MTVLLGVPLIGAFSGAPLAGDGTVGRLLGDTSSWTFTRSTPAWGFGPLGTLVEAPIDTLRWEFNPTTLAPFGAAFAGARTNTVTNPRAEGAVAGAPGTAPTGWGSNTTGRTINGLFPYGTASLLDLSYTVGGADNRQLRFETAVVAASVGQSWSASGYIALVSGTGVSARVFLEFRDGGGSIIGSPAVSSTLSTIDGVVRRLSASGTAPAGTARVTAQVQFDFANATTARFYYGLTQVEQGLFASSATLPPIGTPGASTRAQGNANVPIEQLGTRYNRRAGTVIVNWNSQPGAFTSAADTDWFGLFSLGDLGANEVMGVLVNPAHTNVEFRRIVGGVAQTAASVTQAAPAAGATTRVAFSWDIDAGLMQVAARGVVGTQLTGQASIPSITHAMPGRFSTTRPLFGRLSGLEIRPAAVFGSALASLTA
jgi:hypothetical protein